MTFISYAQNFEDVMLWRVLGHVENGFYMDVGAFSPDIHSVTRAFYDRGWYGINIEPNPTCLEELKSFRARDVNLGIAVSDEIGEAELHVIEGTGLTTLHGDIAETHATKGWAAKQITVQTRTLNAVWAEHVPADQPVHFLKIDVEGHERAVISGLDWMRHRPWVVVVEATVPMSEEVSYAEWDIVLTDAGYDMVYWDGLNRFYVANERSDLKSAFSRPPNVFDEFVVADHAKAQAEKETAKAELARERKTRVELERALEAARSESERLRDLVEAHEKQTGASGYLATRPFWERALFRETGKPKRPLRRLLFHTSGKPRGIFRNVVLRPDGRPHSPFRKWMHSDLYQSLPKAVRLPGLKQTESDGLSLREAYFIGRLQAARTAKGKK